MTGNRVGITERDRRLCAEVSRYGVIAREQLIRLGLFRSKTRANERLKKLADEGYLLAVRQSLPAGGPRLVYVPGSLLRQGEQRSRLVDASALFIDHQLGLVDIRLAFERHTSVTRWMSDRDLATTNLGFVPDGYCEYELHGRTYCAFIEYDRGTETLARFERKAGAYKQLAFGGGFTTHFNRKFFRVIVCADGRVRLNNLARAVARQTDRIFWFATMNDLRNVGPLAVIWRRPDSETQVSITTN